MSHIRQFKSDLYVVDAQQMVDVITQYDPDFAKDGLRHACLKMFPGVTVFAPSLKVTCSLIY